MGTRRKICTDLCCYFLLHVCLLLLKLLLQLLLELHGTWEDLFEELLDACFIFWGRLCILGMFGKFFYESEYSNLATEHDGAT